MDVRIAEQLEPGQRSARDEALFFSRDCFRRCAKFLGTARFDFRKNERVAVAANQIDLAAFRRTVVAVKHLVAAAAQVPGGDLLPVAAQGVARIREGRAAPGEPGESCGDGLDKAHEHAA